VVDAVILAPALADVIEGFRDHPEARRCETPDGARHYCAATAAAFARSCWVRDLDARLVFFSGPARPGRSRARWAGRVLTVAWVAGVFVDWSARQHTPAAELPWLFTDPAPRVPGVPWPGRLFCDLPDREALREAGLAPRVDHPALARHRRALADFQRERRQVARLRRLRRDFADLEGTIARELER
jgi:hypothetical protein